MEKDLKIKRIISIFEGEFFANKKPAPMIKRHSDCFVHYLSGEIEYDFGDYSFVATTENFFYLAKNSSYDIIVRKPGKYICIDFDFEDGENDRKGMVFQNRSVSLKNDFERRKAASFIFEPCFCKKTQKNERNVNNPARILQNNLDITMVLWYDNHVHISYIRGNAPFLIKNSIPWRLPLPRMPRGIKEGRFERMYGHCKNNS